LRVIKTIWIKAFDVWVGLAGEFRRQQFRRQRGESNSIATEAAGKP
jgi:hypothetical protein